MRHGASVIKAQIERKVRRGDTVYEMIPRGAAGEATATLPVTPAAAPATDALGIPLPEPRAKAFAALGDFQQAQDLFDRLATLLDRIAQSPAGELYRLEMLRTANNGQAGFACTALRVCRNKLLATEPYCSYCPNCHPTHPERPYPSCRKCGGRGWTTRAAFDSCGESDRQHILKMRNSSAK
jgi:hypothetical protein